MKSIEKFGKIDRTKLSEEFYFQSLMELGFELEMLSPADLERIQLECLAILAKQTELYTKGNSSSIRIEAAKDILASIMFAIGAFLKTFPLPDYALAVLKSEKMDALYQLGLKRIASMLRTAKITHASITRSLFETKNVFYNETVIYAMEEFFKKYDPAFGAHKIHISADYPVYLPVMHSAGIEFILGYLENISRENSFCLRFPPAAVHKVLYGYVEEFEKMVVNIYEPLLTSAAGCVLSGADPRLLNLTVSNISFLEGLFRKKSDRDIKMMLSEAFGKIQETFAFKPGVAEYMNKSLPQITSTIKTALMNKTPERVFIIPK
jgi:hypothetical protein